MISHQLLIGTVHVITVPMFPIGQISQSGLGMSISSVKFSHSVMSDSLWSHRMQQARFPCPSPNSGVCANSCPSSQWCHPTISTSAVPFSSCLQSFPPSGFFFSNASVKFSKFFINFHKNQKVFFVSSGQSMGVSASTSVLPMNIQDWFPLG